MPPQRPLDGTDLIRMGAEDSTLAQEQFVSFVLENEGRLRRAFVSAYGGQRGRDATAEALAYAWEHWERVSKMDNAPGYLFRVGQSRTRLRKVPATFERRDDRHESIVESGLVPALESLSARQRTAVVLVHGFGWTLREVGEMTGTKVTTVQNHLERGLAKLRKEIGGVGQ